MSVSLKRCKFEMSIHYKSFNDECEIVKEVQDPNLLCQESKLTCANLQLNWFPSKPALS